MAATPLNREQKQREVEQFWDAKPCDSDTSQKELYSQDYFGEIEAYRYSLQSHIPVLLNSLCADGKRVLEIGTGTGTDARNIISLGGIYTGLNVDAGSSEMTRTALEVFGKSGEVWHASALKIPCADETFDIVYSFGVLHHIPAVENAVEEIRRVLKPGGLVVVMLYNRDSINYRLEIRHLRKWGLALLGAPGLVSVLARLGLPRVKLNRHLELRSELGTMSDEEWLSRNTDGPDNPYSRVYDESDAEALFVEFEQVDQYVRYFDYRHWGVVGKLIPARLRNVMGNLWGWHRIVTARKPLKSDKKTVE
jgi:SAM-dependent methyltransferase